MVDEKKEFKTRQRSMYHDMHKIVAKIMPDSYVYSVITQQKNVIT